LLHNLCGKSELQVEVKLSARVQCKEDSVEFRKLLNNHSIFSEDPAYKKASGMSCIFGANENYFNFDVEGFCIIQWIYLLRLCKEDLGVKLNVLCQFNQSARWPSQGEGGGSSPPKPNMESKQIRFDDKSRYKRFNDPNYLCPKLVEGKTRASQEWELFTFQASTAENGIKALSVSR
jgi:hypothetical protein